MTHETPPFRYTETIDEWIDRLPAGLDFEPIGMWEIVPAGRRGYGLDGQELVTFVKRAVRRLLDHGCRPVKRDPRGPYYWGIQKQYGETIDEIAENIIDDWLGWGAGDPDHGGLWLASREQCQVRNLSKSEWLDGLPAELAKGMARADAIIWAGRYDYELQGADLGRFIADAVRRLLEHGALPAKYNLEGPHEFTIVTQYGETAEEIISNIVAAWNAGQDRALDDLHFVTRELLDSRRD
jgi:hypothetical protein